MPIEVIATATNDVNANAETTGISVTHGFTLVNGDVLVAVVGQGDDIGTSITSSGWTAISTFHAQAGFEDRAAQALRKVITDAGSEPSSYTFIVNGNNALENLVAHIIQVRGVNTTTPEDATTTELSDGLENDNTPDHISITTATDGALVLIYQIAVTALATWEGYTAGAPSGYTTRGSDFHSEGTGSNSVWLQAASLLTTTAGTYDPGVWTTTPDTAILDNILFSVAMRPAPSGPLSANAIFTIPRRIG